MQNLESLWQAAKTDAPSQPTQKRDPVPTGTYQTWVEKATLDLTKTPAQVALWYKIEEGEHTGRILFANYSLSEVGLPMLKKELAKLGYTAVPKSMEDLQAALDTLYGKKAEVYAKHRTYLKKDGTTGDAHNVYVNTTLAATTRDVTPVDTNDEIPF